MRLFAVDTGNRFFIQAPSEAAVQAAIERGDHDFDGADGGEPFQRIVELGEARDPLDAIEYSGIPTVDEAGEDVSPYEQTLAGASYAEHIAAAESATDQKGNP